MNIELKTAGDELFVSECLFVGTLISCYVAHYTPKATHVGRLFATQKMNVRHQILLTVMSCIRTYPNCYDIITIDGKLYTTWLSELERICIIS